MNEDADLLDRYVRDRSESAFSELIRRQVDLVYSAALRLVGGDVHRAEDVTQQVFSELARQAKRLRRHPAIPGWLYTTTRLMALRTIRTEQRRNAREQEANAMNELLCYPVPERDWNHLRPVLDDAMHELSEKDRRAVLLRFFQKKSLKEVGLALGLSENAARMRVERSLDKLRAQLARKGVTTTAAALTVMLGSHAVTAASSSFVATLTSATLAGAATVTASTFSILNVMTMTKLKVGFISAVVMGSVATSIVVERKAQAQLRQQDAALQQQVDQLAQLRVENERLDKLAAFVRRPPANSQEELQRLRDEVAALRRQTNELAALRDKSRRLQASLTRAQQDSRGDKSESTVMSEEAKAKMNYGRQLVLAMMEYASRHQDQFPTTVDQVSKLVSAETKKATTFTTSQFEIVYQGSRDALAKYAHPGGILLLRETQPWRNTDGKWAKVYFFSDGSATVLSQPDGNFETWEKQHIIAPESSKP